MHKAILAAFFLCGLSMARAQDSLVFPAWQKGCMDIHHINTGRGNSTFLVLPDGTTLLIDAGDLDRAAFEKKNAPLRTPPALPSDTVSAGKAIVNYIRQVAPLGQNTGIDYALITHFHADHYGQIDVNSPVSGRGAYQLSGMTEVGDLLPIRNMIDRGYPAYDFPVDLRRYYKSTPGTAGTPSSPGTPGVPTPPSVPSSFLNYLDFVEHYVATGKMKAAALQAGRDDQIVLCYDARSWPDFHIRNIKAGNQVWTGKDKETIPLFSAKDVLDKKGAFNENPLSLALRISYGKFDYYTGGDNTGREGEDLPGGRDSETPMAGSVGKVDAMSLDHHGNRDANNAGFLKVLSPRVVVAQTWCSDQPGQETAHRLANGRLARPLPGKTDDLSPGKPAMPPPDVFYLYLQEATRITLGPWITRSAKSMEGHVVIRVMPGGDEFYAFVLDDRSPTPKVKSRFGPYRSE
jgi:beta-lactamase superfamily II metal-dependent hydrolase